MARVERVGWIEHTRALGACAVALLHVFVSTQAAIPLEPSRELAYLVANNVLCRWAVPAFFMITGMLLLDPGRPLGWDRVWRYARRMLVVLATFGLVFALMQEVWTCRGSGAPITWKVLLDSVVDVLTMNTWTHLWYVYALAGVYLLLPLVWRVQARYGRMGLVALTAILVLVGLVAPTVNGCLEGFGLPYVPVPEHGLLTYGGYLLSGLANACVGGLLRERSHERGVVAIGGVCVATMVVWAVVTSIREQYWWGFLYLHTSILPCGYAAGVLVVLRRVFGDGPIRPGSLVAELASDSFGIYVIHPLFIHLGMILVRPAIMVPVVYELLFTAVVVALAAVLTRVLRHVPVVGDVL